MIGEKLDYGPVLRIAIVLFGLWLVLRFIKRALAKRHSDSPAPPPPADMLRCDYCGMFMRAAMPLRQAARSTAATNTLTRIAPGNK